MSHQQNGLEYTHKDGEMPFWLEDITKWVDALVIWTEQTEWLMISTTALKVNFWHNALFNFRPKVNSTIPN